MLTDKEIKNAKPASKPKKLFDGDGLYLEISPSGGKWWRLKYRFLGKEKRLSLGVYPEISLKEARERKDESRKLLSNGVDPSENRKASRKLQEGSASNSFEGIARQWFAKYSTQWADSHSVKVIRLLERDIFPWLGTKVISEITAPEVLESLQRIEKRGAIETAHRALGNCNSVFRYGVANGFLQSNPARDLRGALTPVKGEHFPAITDPKEVAELLRAIDGYQGTLIVKCALQLAPLVFVRPGELRQAEWSQIDFDKAEWRYLVTKTDTQHVVPLATQAIAILQELHPLTGNSRYVFPSALKTERPMSDNAINAALRRMGIPQDEMTGHGFRAMARTILDEELGFRPELIEHQLAHSVRDPNGRAYNRTAHLPARKEMMQKWADYLDDLKNGGRNVIIANFSKG